MSILDEHPPEAEKIRQRIFIGISGIIGSGKSILAKNLADELGFELFQEPVKTNPYLADFYRDPKRYGALMQMFLLFKRFQQHMHIVWSVGKSVVQDRTVYEDAIFAQMLHDEGYIEARDFEVYMNMFNNMKKFIVYPDIIFYLDVKPETAYERAKARGREEEKNLSLDYLKKLKNYYDEFVHGLSRYVHTVTIDWDKIGDTKPFVKEIENFRKRDFKFFKGVGNI